MKDILAAVIAAVEAEGERLAAEFLRPDGPRGRRGSAPIDVEIEERLREELQALVPCPFVGEETGLTPGPDQTSVWIVDPQDGTFEFTSGKRGSAVSVALVKDGIPVLGVVCSPLSPDRGRDTIAWAEDAGPLLRNGKPVNVDLSQRLVGAGEFVFATASSALRPGAWSRAVAPARYIAMPSIAYRLARIAAGDGVATVSTHGVNEYDIAAGMALLRASGGVALDAEGKEIQLSGELERRLSGCFAGAPGAAAQLARHDWKSLENEPPLKARVTLGFPRKASEAVLAQAQGCLLGQVIGDSLGSLVEFKAASEIARLFPQGVRALADGGVFHTIAGQPTDDSEMALALARCLVAEREFLPDKVLDAYRGWLTSRPLDIGATTERGLLGMHTTESESNGSLMRVSPIGVWAAGDPGRAARVAREDSALTHKNPLCIEACAAYAAAIAVGVVGQGTIEERRYAMRVAALAN
ncbi:MAG TPA: inositol monophosphatase family protein, partial [Burkholderiales bacterium]|nr:inositol monophosphatase family protein [Burkholderiales bacterium]